MPIKKPRTSLDYLIGATEQNLLKLLDWLANNPEIQLKASLAKPTEMYQKITY